MMRAPNCSRILHTVVLPVAILPVRPIIYIVKNAVDTELPPVVSCCQRFRLRPPECQPCLWVTYWGGDCPDTLSSVRNLAQSSLAYAKNLGAQHPIKYRQMTHNAK